MKLLVQAKKEVSKKYSAISDPRWDHKYMEKQSIKRTPITCVSLNGTGH
jgi:hypothetical protein